MACDRLFRYELCNRIRYGPVRMTPHQQLAFLKKNAVDLFSPDEFLDKLKENRPLKVKLGVDPSRPDLHLGHAVVLRKLRDFQQLGHDVILIIGDFTARIGDPTGRSKTRPMLSAEEVRAYAQTYQDQVWTVLDPKKTQIRFNGEWLDPMSFESVIRLAAKYTVARMLERDDFHTRYQRNEPISVAEFLYPLAQAYDSVAIDADIELGGTDQLFNLLVGRKIQEEHGQRAQVVMTLPLLEGTDGSQKMSKSLDNYIAFTDSPADVFGKIMSIPDSLMPKYYRLLTDLEENEVDDLFQQIDDGLIHPRDAKMRLGESIVSFLHSPNQAREARETFVRVFQKRETPKEMPKYSIAEYSPVAFELVADAAKLSKSESKRLILQGGAKINEIPIQDPFAEVKVSDGDVLRVGKRRFFRIACSSRTSS